MFDGEAFWESYVSDSRDDPPTPLLCQIYAMSLVYWKHIPKLAGYPKPDVRYAVNLTVAALHEEFSAPGLSTLSAALVDLTGRPIFSMTGNAISCGRTVSLAHCLGLNRDPTNWKISPQEKNQRIRLWWGVVIHDRWYAAPGTIIT
jgi:Fungal specific transcription factor domain